MYIQTMKMTLLTLLMISNAVSCRQSEDSSEVKSAKYLDVNANCNYWAAIGECSNSPNYMLGSCPNACANVGVIYNQDLDTECPAWAARGECSRSSNYMLTHCVQSCKAHFVNESIAFIQKYRDAKAAAAEKKLATENAQKVLDKATTPTTREIQYVTIDGRSYPKCQYLVQQFTKDAAGRIWGSENNAPCVLMK